MQFGAEDVAVGDAFEKAQIEGECFVGDTLVWIKPWVSKFTGERHEKSYIEDIKVGDEVLSRCEITSEMAYKTVTKVFAHRDAKVSVIACDHGSEYFAKFGPEESSGILTTANHPFWVEGKGWTKVRDLQAGDEFLTQNGVKATFRIANLDAFEEDVYNFEVEDFHTYFVESAGIWVHNKSPIDFKRMDNNAVADPKPQWIPLHDSEANLTDSKASLEQRQRELTDITNKTDAERQEVYNFEGEEFHTYYVGDVGVWVHNTYTPEQTIAEKADLQSVCFDGDTPILRGNGSFSKIENLEVGSIVMSRCEKTGEMAAKRVIRIYEHIAKTYALAYNPGPAHVKRFPSRGFIYVTGEHPFWVQGKGWTPVCELKPGDAFLTHNDDPTTVDYVMTPDEFAISMSQGTGAVAYAGQVYNLEVEDFNTYFVDTPGIWVHNCNNVTPNINRISLDVVTPGQIALADDEASFKVGKLSGAHVAPGLPNHHLINS